MKRLIMTVDDSKTIREMVSFTLKTADYDVLEAEDGVQALDVLGSKSPDLIITDVNMPNMDGITLIGKLREMDKFKSIPIIMLTTEHTDDKKTRGRSAGATGWIVKPFDPEKLIQVVNKLCQ
jgi:two-component system chemotaxis response regulator CheY